MRAISAPELLGVWERGLGQLPLQRALSLLAAACPEMSLEALAALNIGRRDAHLLTLREWTFGSRVAGLTACPACGERLELTFDVADIRAASESESPAKASTPGPDMAIANLQEEYSVNASGYEVGFRLPTGLDAEAIADSENVHAARGRLLERCVLHAWCDGEDVSAGQLPDDVVTAIAERMAQADPQADVQLAVTCPKCDHAWQTTFDIVSFFWSEINAWATRILREVHDLASAYGWREADILAMSPLRRQLYLEMIGRSS